MSNSRKWFICMRGRSFVTKKLWQNCFILTIFLVQKTEKTCTEAVGRQQQAAIFLSVRLQKQPEAFGASASSSFLLAGGKKNKTIFDESRSRWVGRGAGGVSTLTHFLRKHTSRDGSFLLRSHAHLLHRAVFVLQLFQEILPPLRWQPFFHEAFIVHSRVATCTRLKEASV